MKKLFLFLALLFSSSALAQSAKVLVCAPGNLAAAKTTDSALAKFYAGSIDVSDTITEAINNYEAVFLKLNNPITQESESILESFLHSNKKLYIEYEPGLFIGNPPDSNGFWRYIGVTGFAMDELFSSIQFVLGIKGTFTEGLMIQNPKWNPVDQPFGGIWGLSGNIKLVLSSTPDHFGLAYTYETDSFKVVLHWPAIPDYYDVFLGRVICNYFGLCAPLYVKLGNENPQTEFSLFPNPARDVLHIWGNTENPELQSAELISESGSFVTKFSFGGNLNHIDLDLGSKNISTGNYFLRLNTERESFVKRVFLLTK